MGSKRLKILLLTTFLAVFAFFSPIKITFAQETTDNVLEDEDTNELESIESEDIKKEEIKSFELFWPVVAGRTKADRFYFLKRVKEKVRGALIFGKPQKADYKLLLATKRSVEAEKLLQNSEVDLAKETFGEANELVREATSSWNEVEDKGESLKSQKDELNVKLDKLNVFLPYLSDTYPNQANDEINALIESLFAFKNSV